LHDSQRTVFPIRKRIAAKNIELCFPNTEEKWRKQLLHKTYQTLFRSVLFSFSKAPYMKQEQLENLIEGFPIPQEFVEDVNKRKGVIIVTAHIGFWELLPFLLNSFNLEKVIVYKELHDIRMERFVAKTRELAGVTRLKDSGSMVRLEQVLKRGGIVGLVSDQRPNNNFYPESEMIEPISSQ